MEVTNIIPVHLQKMGVIRLVSPEADLLTIWKTPYPIIGEYTRLCGDMGVEPFAGGTMEHQGPKNRVSYITSGYRDKIIESRTNSPHLFGLAIDVAVGDLKEQIKWALAAQYRFPRIGLYPANGFIHLDYASNSWIYRYEGKRAWVKKSGVYIAYDSITQLVGKIRSRLI